MKRLSQQILMLLVLSSLLTSCSWLSKRRALFEAEEAAQTPVTREQYDQLAKQYEELSERHRLLQQEFQKSRQDPELLNELKLAEETPELAETVDVFSSSPKVEKKVEARPNPVAAVAQRPVIDSRDLDAALVEEHILTLRNSEELIQQKRYDQALRELKKIEASPVRQIRVRAKFNLGEVLFQQGEFDLAMQIFEDLIKTEAFSGVVLKTLGRLIVCSEKLNLDQKKETYFSILHDFFEQTS